MRNNCYYKVKVVPYGKRKKSTICFNCSGFFHSAKNYYIRPRCIKCNGQHANQGVQYQQKIKDSVCIKCGEKGHWRPGKDAKHYWSSRNPPSGTLEKATCKQQIRRKDRRKNMETKTDKVTDLTDLKDSLQMLKMLLLQEFQTLLQEARHCRNAKSRQEKMSSGAIVDAMHYVFLERNLFEPDKKYVICDDELSEKLFAGKRRLRFDDVKNYLHKHLTLTD